MDGSVFLNGVQTKGGGSRDRVQHFPATSEGFGRAVKVASQKLSPVEGDFRIQVDFVPVDGNPTLRTAQVSVLVETSVLQGGALPRQVYAHNLENALEGMRFTVIPGLSDKGPSSLAFDHTVAGKSVPQRVADPKE